MLAYPRDQRDTLLEAFTHRLVSRDRVVRRHPFSWRVLGALLAGAIVYCGHIAEMASWTVPGSIALPLMLMVVPATCFLAFKVIELLMFLRHLAGAMEQEGIESSALVLSEDGPAPVARVARAINRSAHQRAARQAELLHVLAAYAHDQRTPLTRMGMRCEMLDDPLAREALQRDLAEMAELVEASVACARLQCSGEEPTRAVDADGLLDALIDDYRDAGRCIELDGHVGHPVVTCPHALRRVLVNLIDNALRYGGDARLCVRVEARRLVLAVLDSGPGILPSQMEAVFAPWYRAPETATRVAGSGLGLAIARRLTLAMRGELELENRRTGGLEARLTLPLASA